MSGGGGGGTSNGGDGIANLDCGDIVDTTILSSPDPEVIGDLGEDNILELQLGSNNAVEAQASDGQIAGTVTFAYLPRLITCLEEGHEYIARILSIEGGACRVEVRPSSNG